MSTLPKRLSARHVMTARLVAMGLGRRVISEMIGYSVDTISRFRQSPALNEAVGEAQRKFTTAMVNRTVDQTIGKVPCPRCARAVPKVFGAERCAG